MKSKIGLDFRAIAAKEKSGVESYILQLAELVPKKMPNDKFYFFVDKSATSELLKKYKVKNVRIIKLPFSREKLFWSTVKLMITLFNIDLFHFPLGIIPVKVSCKKVVTIYDLTYEFYPEFYNQWELNLQKDKVPKAARECNKIITISKSTKKDIHNNYHIENNKIIVIYPPLPKIKWDNKSTELKEKLYFLAVGNIQPRKNFIRIIEAFSRMPEHLKLYIVGKAQQASEMNKISTLIEHLSLSDRVKVTGYINDEALSRLYDGAIGLVFASIYEGFGYPIIEAFSRGIPVIASKGSSTEEVAGSAGIIVDPFSIDSIATSMNELIQNPVKRKELIIKGHNRFKELINKDFGEEIANVYKEVLNE